MNSFGFMARRNVRTNNGLLRNNVPQIVFSNCTKKQSSKISFCRAKCAINDILLGDFSKIQDLEKHMSFMDNSELCKEFFSILPYDLLINLVTSENQYLLPSIIIVSRCISNKFCPHNFFSSITTNFALAKFLYSLMKDDFNIATQCFRIFSAMILVSPEIRDFLLTSGVIEYIYQYANGIRLANVPYKKTFFLKKASDFIINCLRSNPILDQSLIENVSQAYFFFLRYENESIVSYILVQLKDLKKSDQIRSAYPHIFNESFAYISENLISKKSPEISMPVYDLIQDIDSLEYMKITIVYLQNIDSVPMKKKCLKMMVKRSQEWSSVKNDEVCQILLQITESSYYAIRKLAAQVFLLYWDKRKMINDRILNMILNFITEKDFGIICMNTIFYYLNDSFSQDLRQSLINELLNQDFESTLFDIIENGTELESNTASLLLDAFHAACSSDK